MISFYLGRISETQAVTAAASAQAKDARSESCEASFYLGEDRLTQGRRDEARALLQAAAKSCPSGFYEAAAAKADLKRLAK
jgi:lipoprotein NlpI